jgi:hypothetical protein
MVCRVQDSVGQGTGGLDVGKEIDISAIRTDGGTQMRAELSKDVYLDYRDKMNAGVEFPPVDVFFDGSTYWLADGFHRFHGAREAECKAIKATEPDGTVRDAILFAVGANQGHGLRRSNQDKRNAVTTLLNDETWVKWSDNKIADQAGVSDMMVAGIRSQLQESCTSPAAKTKDEPKIGKDGKSYPAKKPTPKKAPAEVDFGCRSAESAPKISGGTTFDPSEWTPQNVTEQTGEAPVPALESVFAVATEFDAHRKALTNLKKWINQRAQHAAGRILQAGQQRIITDIDNLDREIKFARPHSTCCYCKNEMPKLVECSACKGSGWISEDVYKQAPKGIKKNAG